MTYNNEKEGKIHIKYHLTPMRHNFFYPFFKGKMNIIKKNKFRIVASNETAPKGHMCPHSHQCQFVQNVYICLDKVERNSVHEEKICKHKQKLYSI